MNSLYWSVLPMITVALLMGVPAAADEERIPPLSAPLPEPAPVAEQDHLGFVVHMHERGMAEYLETGARTMLMNLFFWNMRDEEKQLVDFGRAEEWLAWLYVNGLHGAPIIDTSPYHTNIPWRSAITEVLGENIRNPEGTQSDFGSPYSPTYKSMVEQYVADLTGWFIKHDTAGQVTTYVNGAEVFWPGMLDYGPLAQEEFRRWLINRYGSLEAINDRWGASFASVDDIEPVPVYRFGQMEFGPNHFFIGIWQDGSWMRPVDEFTPGAVYDIQADVRATDTLIGGVTALMLWMGDNDQRQTDCIDVTNDTNGSWTTLSRRVKAPEWATEAQILLSLQSHGQAEWRNARITDVATGDLLLCMETEGNTDAADNWSFSRWGGDVKEATRADDDAVVTLVLSAERPTWPVERPQAAWYDFHTFSMETFAQIMNHWGQRIRHHDPDRETMHYLGFLLGTLSQWDDLMQTQRPDIFLANAPDIDINGLQICAAKGDYHSATAVLDLARKYDKPMVATDLQDFTHGTYVGYNSLNRTSLACVAHGMTGSYYYTWRDHNIDYNWFENWTMGETRRMLTGFRKARDFVSDGALHAQVAFILPILPYCDADPQGRKSDMLDAMGWYKLLRHAGVTPDIYTPYELDGDFGWDLRHYPIVFVPDCPFLPVNAAAKLQDYVEAEGTIVFGGRPPLYDETGRLLPAPFGAEERPLPEPGAVSIGDGTTHYTGDMNGTTYLGPMWRTRVAGNTPPLYIPDSQRTEPMLQEFERDRSAMWVREVLETVDAMPTVYMDQPDAHVDVVIYETADDIRAILVHKGAGQHWGGSVRASGELGEAVEVLADFESRPAEASREDDGEWKLALPVFTDVCLIRWNK